MQGNGLYIHEESEVSGIKNIKGEYLFQSKYNIETYYNYFILKTSAKFKNRKIIIIDKDGKSIYSEALKSSRNIFPVNNYLIAEEDKKSGRNTFFRLRNLKTKETSERIYSKVYNEVNGLIKVRKYIKKDGEFKWGFINTNFETVIDFIYSNEPGGFIENRILVKSKNKKFGFIDEKGKLVIEPTYIKAFDFVNSKALVRIHRKKYLANKKVNYGYRIIDANGKIIQDLENMKLSNNYSKENPIEENGTIRVNIKNGSYISSTQYLFNINTEKISKNSYDNIEQFNSGFAVVEFKDEDKKKRVGYINKEGKLIFIKALLNKF